MHKWASVKLLQYNFGRLDFTRLYHQRRLQFLAKLQAGTVTVLKECYALAAQYEPVDRMLQTYSIDLNSGTKNLIASSVTNLIASSVTCCFTELCEKYL